MTEDDIDVDAVVNSHKDETSDGRHATEAAVEKEDIGDDTPSLEDAVADAFAAIDDDEDSANEHLTTRDRNLSALFTGLDNADQLAALGQQAADELDRDESPETQAEVIRLLLRYSIADLDDGLISSLADGLKAYEKAKAQQAVEQVDEGTL